MSSAEPARARLRARALAQPGRAAALALLAIALVTLVVRLPSAVHSLLDRADRSSALTPLDRETAAADPLGIDNTFVLEALQLVPAGKTFAVATPATDAIASTYGIQPVTRDALPGYMQDLMLPRREVDPARADYLLCYACDTAPFDPRMTRLWQSDKGYVIGRLRR